MSFLDTEPAAIHRLDADGPWARFRVTDPRQRTATLRELWRGDVPLTIGRAGGATFPALLWSIDGGQANPLRHLHFNVAPELGLPHLTQAIAGPELWAAGYLHEAKVQFDLRGLRLDTAGSRPVLHAAEPRTMLHLPRRRAVRVRRDEAHAPAVLLRDPRSAGPAQRWRVADISMTGCALVKPPGVALLSPGVEWRQAEVELDADNLFIADLQVHHVSRSTPSRAGLRIGCAWRGLSSGAADMLQAWIMRGRRRRDLISLAFD